MLLTTHGGRKQVGLPACAVPFSVQAPSPEVPPQRGLEVVDVGIQHALRRNKHGQQITGVFEEWSMRTGISCKGEAVQHAVPSTGVAARQAFTPL